MDLAESIVYTMYGFLVLILIAIAWLVFRKRKRWAVALTVVLLIGYIGFYAYYPIMKSDQHAERYEQLTAYLESNYPEEQFTVIPETYETGYSVGMFEVNKEDVPNTGVTLQVDDGGEVQQISNWTNFDFPQQSDLWRELRFHYGGQYTLDREDVEIAKQDERIDGELTVFALDINGNPAIAVYEYSEAGYGMLDLQESPEEDFVFAEVEGRVFAYIDERYTGDAVEITLQDGRTISVDVDRRGELFQVEP